MSELYTKSHHMQFAKLNWMWLHGLYKPEFSKIVPKFQKKALLSREILEKSQKKYVYYTSNNSILTVLKKEGIFSNVFFLFFTTSQSCINTKCWKEVLKFLLIWSFTLFVHKKFDLESILPNFDFFVFLIFVVKLECL